MKEIKILGAGCRKCEKLYEEARKAAEELGIAYQLDKVTDMDKIVSYGVMMTPALVIGEEVKSSGKLLKAKDIKTLLSE